MQVRRVLRALALVLVVGTSPSVAVAPASATATSPQTSASEPDSASPRELDLVVGVTPNTTALTLHAVADDWAAGHRVVLQRRTTDGWTKVATRRFSLHGRARWQLDPGPQRGTYRAVTRVGGERYVSPRVGFSR